MRRTETINPRKRKAVFMSKVDSEKDRADRIGRIQVIVQEDYDRIQAAEGPFTVLNLATGSSPEEVRDRYERYERFYRAENFQRLGDMDLTRKALEIRRAIGRAMVQIQSNFQTQETPAAGVSSLADREAGLPEVDPDAAAMGDIYFRDGLSYLRLGDFNAAFDQFQRASDYDPSRGIILANLAYTRFKIDPTDEEVADQTGRRLQRAAQMEPDNPEIFSLVARFGINRRDKEVAEQALKRLESIDPTHPRLTRLKKRANF